MKTLLGVKNNNELKKIQKILLNQMERLDNNEIMKDSGKREIMRSGAISQSSISFIKSIQTQLRILEMSGKYNVEVNDMNNYLGIKSDE